jgi:small subunit ribosomal protein S11
MANSDNKRKVAISSVGKVYIKATYNNIIISITNANGQVCVWSSAGKMGFKCAKKKNTPYAGQLTATDCAKKALDLGMSSANVFVKGIGMGRETAIRAIQEVGINVLKICDTTEIPFNGCRPPKRRNF